MALSIERRLQLMGDVSNLLLMGSIHVYGTRQVRVHVTMPSTRTKRKTLVHVQARLDSRAA